MCVWQWHRGRPGAIVLAIAPSVCVCGGVATHSESRHTPIQRRHGHEVRRSGPKRHVAPRAYCHVLVAVPARHVGAAHSKEADTVARLALTA